MLSRNVCVFADGEVDRSPTGSGVSGRMALHHAQGKLKVGDSMIIESIVGSQFTGKVLRQESFGPYEAVIPEVGGMAYVTGEHRFWIDPEDPFRWFFVR
ncbi:MAG: proline racemase family protein [Saprospiraceae bacterium]